MLILGTILLGLMATTTLCAPRGSHPSPLSQLPSVELPATLEPKRYEDYDNYDNEEKMMMIDIVLSWKPSLYDSDSEKNRGFCKFRFEQFLKSECGVERCLNDLRFEKDLFIGEKCIAQMTKQAVVNKCCPFLE